MHHTFANEIEKIGKNRELILAHEMNIVSVEPGNRKSSDIIDITVDF